jgi:outer membrane protein OmpA-like peptidoglycan-associated protein
LFDNTHLELADLVKDDLRVVHQPAMIVPLRAGLSFRLSPSMALDVAFQYNFTNTDYLDGVSVAGNPSDRDRYGQVRLGATFALGGGKDSDQDGIPDAKDDCPFQAGSLAAQGCPDADADGVPDETDRCPYAPGPAELEGCPDTDGDGVTDPFDRCPAQPGPPEALGCPIQDTDGDGMADHLDACPLAAGPAHRQGCPAIDTDGDGLLDEDDTCPEAFGLRLFNGCPDTDGDGIEDIKDACPNHVGRFDAGGCPTFKSAREEAQVLGDQMLHFRANSADVINFAMLDRLADFLRRQPSYRIQIHGHADGAGGEEGPVYISQLRAERVKRYLTDSGIDETRITARGFSGQHPLDTSGTATGRAKNRRVGFDLGTGNK